MYRRRRSRKINARTIFLPLLVAVFLAVWLPASWTRPLNQMMQLLAPVEDALNGMGATAADALGTAPAPTVPTERFQSVERDNQALTHTVTALSARVAELESRNRELTGLRATGLTDGGVLIPARVIRRDAAAWRDSVLLDRGASSASDPNDWVVSHRFVDVGGDAGVSSGMAVLAGEVLVGRVLTSAPYTSVVVLLSDPTQKTPVRIARREGDRLEVLAADFLLEGRGRGRMRVDDVGHNYIDSQQIRSGDLVVSDPGEAGLPVSLVVGRVAGIEPTERSPLLLFRLEVEPVLDPADLRRVYIVDLSPAATH